MFYHPHPYKPFIPKNTTKLIVGTLPPPRFVHKNLIAGDVDFCYGSIKGQLWPILDEIFKLKLTYKNTSLAIEQRKQFLRDRQIGICDIVGACYREKIDASDLGMQQVELRNLFDYLKKAPLVDTLLFTGGNSKNGPEYFFRQFLKDSPIKLTVVSSDHPKIHSFIFDDRTIRTVSLIAPSGAANRAVGSNPVYKQKKQSNPKYTTFDFRVEQYQNHF